MNITLISEKDTTKKRNNNQVSKLQHSKYSKYELKVKKIINDMISKSPSNNSKIRLGIN